MRSKYTLTGKNKATWHSKLCSLIVGVALLALVGCSTQDVTVPTPVPHATAVPTQAPPPTPTSPPPQEEPLAAQVNGEPIYWRDYQKQVTEWETAFIGQNADLGEEEKNEMLAQGRRQVLNVMIEQALIEQAAAREGVVISDAEVDAVIARDIQENGGESQFRSWLEANNWTHDEYKARQRSMMIASQMFERVTTNVPKTAEQVHARHILVATEQEASAILTQLQGGADFAALARQHSLDPSTKESGGDLGFFPRGTLVVPEVEEAAFSLSVGQISDVIHTAMGYHIIEVLERAQDKELTEESWQALKEVTFRRWVSELWAGANVEILIPL